MSIAIRINVIEEHIGNAYKKIDDLGIDLTNVDKNINNIAEMLDTVYEEYPKVTGQGTELTLDGTKVGKLGLDVKGNSTQETTTGKNKLNLVRTQVDYSTGVTLTETNFYKNLAYDGGVGTSNTQNIIDGSNIKVTSRYGQGAGFPFPCNASEKWALTATRSDNDGNLCFVYFDENFAYLSNSGNYASDTLTATTPTNCKWLVALFNVKGSTSKQVTFSKVMLEKSASATDYEPYTNGASPNPSYPQPIYSAGDDINKFDKTTATIGSYVKASNGKLEQYNNTIFATDYIEINQNETYYWNDNSLRPNQGAFYDTNKDYISGIASPSTHYFTTPANAKYVRLTGATEIIDTLKLQKGSIPTIYSPYNMGTISEKIVNKNWFDKNDFAYIDGKRLDDNGNVVNDVDSSYSTTLYRILPNSTYDIQGTQSITGKTTRIYYYDKNKTFLSRSSSYATDSYSFTTPSNCYYIGLQLRNSTYINKDIIQIELGSTATTYTAHQEQTYTIPVQQSMRSIGDVRDEFIQVNGNWFERHNVKSIIFNGSEGWSSTGTQYTGLYSAYVILSDMKRQNVFSGDLLSNYFIEKGFSVQEEGMTKSLQPLDFDFLILRISTDKASTAQELKTWLASNNTEVLYILKDENIIDLPCTEEQIEILENLPKSYNEQTNIYSLDVTPAYIEAKAMLDLSSLIN